MDDDQERGIRDTLAVLALSITMVVIIVVLISGKQVNNVFSNISSGLNTSFGLSEGN